MSRGFKPDNSQEPLFRNYCWCSSCCITLLGSTTAGVNCSVVFGSVDLSLLFMHNCAGNPMLSTPVFLYFSNARYGSSPSFFALLNSLSAVCTEPI